MKKLLLTATIGLSAFWLCGDDVEAHEHGHMAKKHKSHHDVGQNCDCCGDCTIKIYKDALIWDICQDLKIAETATAAAVTDCHFADYDWDLGFRLGAEFQVPNHCWYLRAMWTHISSDADGNTTQPVGGTLTPTLGQNNASTTHTNVEADYNTLDLLASYYCSPCDCLWLNLYGGLRVLWLDFDAHEVNTGGVYTTAGDGARRDQEYTAAGMHGGLGWKVDIGSCMYLLGNFAGSVVCGSEDITTTQRRGGVVTATTHCNNSDHTAFSFETSLGLGYRFEFWCRDVLMHLKYEFVHWGCISNPLSGNDCMTAHGLNWGSVVYW